MSQLAIIQSKQLLSPDDLANLKKNKFAGFTDDEIEYCSKICDGLKLSPFLNQIHFVKRQGKITAQVAIDGQRLAAERAGGYAGSDEPIFEYDSDDKRIPTLARVTVWKMVDGARCPFVGVARWEEFYPGDAQGTMWRKMPHNQLAKCAEVQALRKAFPAELGSVRLDEEMEQADRPQKAQTIQDKLKDEAPAIEAESRRLDESEEVPSCSHCQSTNVMPSKYQPGSLYCRACKKAFAL